MRQLMTRLVWPAPLPSSIPSRQSVIALLLVCLQISQASRRSASSASVGARLVTTFQFSSSSPGRSGVCASSPPEIVR